MKLISEKFELTAEDIAFARDWATSRRQELPEAVYKSLNLLTVIYQDLESAKSKAKDLVRLLRTSMGILPKSERGSRDVAGLVSVQREAIQQGSEISSDQEVIDRLTKQRREINCELRRYHKRRKFSKPPESTVVPGKPSPLIKAKETVFAGGFEQTSGSLELEMPIERTSEFERTKGLHSSKDERTRYDFEVKTTKIKLLVETVTDPTTGKSVTASTDDIGPPNFQVTWTAIANALVAVIGYAIPINRLSKMLSATLPYFTTTRICKMLSYAAELFAPIYEFLGSSLADADVLNGDDTRARVLEVERHMALEGTMPPAKGLVERISTLFGRVSLIKSGERAQKELNVSVIIGKTVAVDPRSYVFFFRTHLGRLGNLLTEILKQRSPRNKELTLQADLSTANYPDSKFYELFKIHHAGCGAHARRPFWRHRDDDQTLCYWMLSAFLILERIEDKLDNLGRTNESVTRYRQRYAKKVWEAMRRRCESVLRGEKKYSYYWPKTSKLYAACNYIVANYDELTRYLDDPRLSSNNNISERALRWDKIMEDSSGFRQSELGRVNIDILRTIVHTCAAAEVDLKSYLLFVFKNRAQIAINPERFTPYAYSLLTVVKH